MSFPVVVLVVAGLLTVVSLAEPVAARLRLPSSVLLAAFGVAVGFAALFLKSGALGEGARHAAEVIADLPLSSDAFLYLFLPALLFQSAMNTDARHLAEDAGSIFTLAIVAVVVSTFVIGLALAPVAQVPLLACLLFGAIVATTDPIAVIGIFHEAGAPGRLVRLVEGESLLNDAAAITMFGLFLDLLVSGRAFDPAATAFDALALPLGGALFGAVLGRLAASLVGLLRDDALAPTSVSLGLPYLAFALAEHSLHVSGVMAVVAAGVVFGAAGPAKAPPDVWRHLREVWAQIDWWAASMIFVLASIVAPKLLADATAFDALLLAIAIAASLVARAGMVFGAMPALAAVGFGPRISVAFRWVVFWGGLRGATTLALALAVTEQEALPQEVRSFVAVLSTGFVFFTLIVQGVTLRPVVRAFGVDRLSPIDLALRRDALAAARDRAGAMAVEAARAQGLSGPLSAATASKPPPAGAAAASPDEKAAIALATLARAERETIMQRVRENAVSLKLVGPLLADARRLGDWSRANGLEGYREASDRTVAFTRLELAALKVARRTGWTGWLAKRLADRFEALLLASAALSGLERFVSEAIEPVLGAEAAGVAAEALDARRITVDRALAALRLQYPDYSHALERRLISAAALRFEETEYDRMHEDGLIGPEVHRDLRLGLIQRRRAGAGRPELDLGLDAETLVRRLPLFAALPDAAVAQLVRLAEPVLARPGESLIRRGASGDAAYFVSSGAVEATTADGRAFRLGRGEVFGEIALLVDRPRTADVTAIAYCSLLCLKRRAFLAFLDDHPEIARQVSATAERRLAELDGATG